MEYQLQLKPFEKKDGLKYKIIKITDFMMHTAQRRITDSPGKKVKESFETGAPGRIYIPNKQSPAEQMGFLDLLNKDPEFMNFIREEEKKGYKVLLEIPKSGIPLLAGKDMIEFIKSKNGKRILRNIEKNKSKG